MLLHFLGDNLRDQNVVEIKQKVKTSQLAQMDQWASVTHDQPVATIHHRSVFAVQTPGHVLANLLFQHVCTVHSQETAQCFA